MAQPRLYVFAGGGSGGHLYPGLAVAEMLRELDATARVLFVATRRVIDSRILRESGWEFLAQPVTPLPRRPGQLWSFWRGWRDSVTMCAQMLEARCPAIVLGLGGFASVPAMKVAAKNGLPVAMLNPDVVPGVANRCAKRYAQRIFVHWQSTSVCFGRHADKCRPTGCPIRKSVVAQPRPGGTEGSIAEGKWKTEGGAEREAYAVAQAHARQQLGLEPGKRTLVVMGGSQGGRNINDAVVKCLAAPATNAQSPTLQSGWQVLHLTGTDQADQIEQQYAQAQLPARVMAFSDEMDAVLVAADLAIARAGASTLAELTATATPSILVPYPYHRDQHQLRNADVLARAEAARIVIDQCDPEKTAEQLGAQLRICMNDQTVLEIMTEAAAHLGKPHAARQVAEELVKMACKEND